jgi:xanthine dehydrogenase accessory factor
LRQRGLKEADLARIHGPVGLAIGGRSAAEIALSIMAEITQVRHALPVPDELAVRDTPHQRQRAP